MRFILMTNYDQRREGERALQQGFSAWITKPIHQEVLFDTIARHLRRRNRSIDGAETRPRSRRKCYLRLPAEAATFGEHNVLLAEDNPANQRLATIQLMKLGYEVDAVSNGQQVIDTFVRGDKSYSLILMDCQMPDLDGFEATRVVRQIETTTGRGRIPIVAMTANAMQGDREVCLAAGMDDYVSKPVTLDVLKQVVERWLKGSSTAKSAADFEQDINSSLPVDEQVLDGIRELQLEGEPDLLIRVDRPLSAGVQPAGGGHPPGAG